MWHSIKEFLIKMFKPLLVVYGLYFFYQVYAYFTGVKFVVNRNIYLQFTILKFVPALLIVCLALIFRLWGKTKLASLVLGIPALISLTFTLLTLLVWLFLAVLMIVFSK